MSERANEQIPNVAEIPRVKTIFESLKNSFPLRTPLPTAPAPHHTRTDCQPGSWLVGWLLEDQQMVPQQLTVGLGGG